MTKHIGDSRFPRRQVLRGGAISSIGVAAALLVGCGDDDDEEAGTQSPSGSSEPAQAGPRSGGTLRMSMPSDPGGLDPAGSPLGTDQHYMYSIFDNLVNLTPDMRPQPGLAEKWEFADPLTLVLTLVDPNFTYHDGTPFSAEDIKYSLERHKDPETKSYASGQVTAIDKIEVVDPRQVKITLKAPTATILANLAERPGMIVSQRSLESVGGKDKFNRAPVGTGPLKFVSWTDDAELKLERFGQYRKPNYPYLDGTVTQVVPNSSVQFANLRTGNADLIFLEPKDASAAKSDSSIAVLEWATTGFEKFDQNIALAPLNDKRVRRAMSLAMNRKAILEAIYFGAGQVAYGPLTPGDWAANPSVKPLEEDLKSAKELLSAAGHADGLSFEMALSTSEVNTPLTQLVQDQWRRVGIDVSLLPLSSDQYTAQFAAQKFPIRTGTWSGRSDPDLTIYDNWHSKGSFNRARLNTSYTPDADQLALDSKMEKARQSYDLEERKALYWEIEKTLVEDAYCLITVYHLERIASSKDVRGITGYADAKLRLHEMWLDG